MATTETDMVLATTEQQSGELAVSFAQATAQHEIEGAIVLAKRFPRNTDTAFAKVMNSCSRYTFAAMTTYSYPRGGQQITGPSVALAREAARCWGNIRYGCDIVHEDDESRTIRGWAWDMESNIREAQDASFKKLIYRKGKKGSPGGWQVPDERDLRELTNRQGAICVRNCLLHLLPPDLIEDALGTAKATISKDRTADPDEARKKLIVAFQGIGVSVEDMEEYLGHPLRQVQTEEIADLRKIWKSVREGNSVWAEYIADKQPKDDAKPEVDMDDLTGAKQPPESSGNGETDTAEPETPQEEPEDTRLLDEYTVTIHDAETLTSTGGCNEIEKNAHASFKAGDLTTEQHAKIFALLEAKREKIRGGRGAGSSKPTA